MSPAKAVTQWDDPKYWKWHNLKPDQHTEVSWTAAIRSMDDVIPYELVEWDTKDNRTIKGWWGTAPNKRNSDPTIIVHHGMNVNNYLASNVIATGYLLRSLGF